MRDFFKNNLLSIVVCLSAMAAFASATSYTRPYAAIDYTGSTRAVGAKVNAEFQGITDFLNNATISSSNIAASGVEITNLATARIQITAASSVFSTTSVSAVAVTNLSTTITSTGRPIQISLAPYDGGSLLSNITTYITGVGHGSTTYGGVIFLRGSTTVANFYVDYGNGTSTTNYPCSAFSAIDYRAAGTYTYTVDMNTSNASDATTMIGCRLIVREVP